MIKKGQKFRCIKDNISWFIKGKVYRSELDMSLKDELGTNRFFAGEFLLKKYFKPYTSNKRKGYGR